MPTLHSEDGYEFQMVMKDCEERKHAHVKGNGKGGAKIWLDLIEVASPGRYNPHEMNQILRIARDNHGKMIKKWNEECARVAQEGAK